VVRHDGITPTFSRTQVIPGLTGSAIVIAVALALGVRGAAPAGAAAHMPPGPAVAAKHQASALTRCLRWARRSRLPGRRARRRRACRHAAAQKRTRANPSRSALFGVSTGGAIPNEDPATLGRDLDADRRLGAGWLRLDVNWAMIQDAGPRSYNWAPIDRVVRGATGRGLRVLGTIVYTPRWARPRGTAATYGPDPGRYAAFAAAAVRHYAAMGVHAYEVWNEPNNSGAWSPKPDPAAYTRLLKAAYPAIKGADPGATVLTGGTGPAPNNGVEIPALDFVTAIYADGG